jgi:transcriptional regulator with XRE-family HTH domain
MKRKARLAPGLSEDEFLNSSTPSIDRYVDISLAIAKYINRFINSQDFKQRDIADKLGKHESEISRWFNGFHNMTLKSIIKLESVCDIKILNPEIYSSAYSFSNADSFVSPTISTVASKQEIISGMYMQVHEKTIQSSALSMYSNIDITTTKTLVHER